ncbi:MAG: di-heme oxidoredictase family protein [Byssovorax sp.]
MPRRAALFLSIPLLAGALPPAPPPVVPWPHGEPPTGARVARLVKDAVELADRERAEEILAAAEHGEDSDRLNTAQVDIDQGRYDKAALFLIGDELFSHEFTLDNGYGDGAFVTMRRVHAGVRGGLDTFSCSGCHSVGGPDGAGAATQNAHLGGDGDRFSTANVRNPPAVLGLGLVQALAVEMSAELRKQRADAIARAKETGAPQTVELRSKGVSFGALVVGADGIPDYRRIQGVDIDLTIKPFGWKGNVARLRRFVEDAARIHFGIQSHVLAIKHEKTPDPAHLGDGALWYDPDHDNHVHELEEGVITATASYLAMLEAPVVLPPRDPGLLDRWAKGSARFDGLGCASCHVRELPLQNRTWKETADTTAGEVAIKLLEDGDEPRGSPQIKLFSDLKRHDMGPALADPHDGEERLPRSVFLTRPLWGVAETPPYLHDGRAATLPEAILAHGGEAKAARDAYAALSRDEQANVTIFLLSLTREPKVRVAR